MTNEEELSIRARLAETTPGPWGVMTVLDKGKELRLHIAYGTGRSMCWNHIAEADLDQDGCIGFPGVIETKANMKFMANARTDIPLLLAELDKLRTERPVKMQPKDGESALIGFFVGVVINIIICVLLTLSYFVGRN